MEKGERTAAHTSGARELLKKAAREGIALPEVACGYLVLLGPERKAIALAAAGRSYNEHSIAQALRATSPHNLATPKEIVQVVDESEGLTEGTDDTVEPGLEGEELQNVVSKLHRPCKKLRWSAPW